MIKRILTAAVLVGIVVAILMWAPIWLFKILILLMVTGALYEFYRMVLPRDYFNIMAGILFGLTFSTILIFAGYRDWFIPVFLGAFFVLILAYMLYSTTVEEVVSRLGLVLFGTVYLSFTLPAFVWLRTSDHGKALIVFTIAIVAVSDTFAYGAGKLIGRHKMSPLISPNKTVEGLVSSFFGGVLAAIICWQIFWPELGIGLVIFLGLIVSLIGGLGDLFESLIKRGCHVKDSGNLLPGHGGILDRLDALIFSAPFVYFAFKFLGKI